MSDAVDLIKAILADPAVSEDTAFVILEEALEREIDPLDYCAATLGVGQALAMQRAAAWAGLPFFDVVPRDVEGRSQPMRLDALARVTAFQVRIYDREVFFSAPDFFELMRLRTRRLANADLGRRVCLVPAAALRDHLVRINAPELVIEARQRLARRWPHAAAQLELTTLARAGFVVILLLLTGLVLLAPFASRPSLLLLTILLLVLPAAVRIAAMLHRPRRRPEPVRPEAGELPVYTVLIPLRDEAHMVPQLVSAMRALDYPALCRKRM